MRGHAQDIIHLINAKQSLIWVNSYEEERVIKDLLVTSKSDTKASNIAFYDWSAAKGIDRVTVKPNGMIERKPYATENTASPKKAVDFIKQKANITSQEVPSAIIVKDFNVFLKNEDIYRTIRDLLETKQLNNVPIIVLSNTEEVPDRLNRLAHVVRYELPEDDYIFKFYKSLATQIEKRDSSLAMTDDDIQSLVVASRGLTAKEIEAFASVSIVEKKKLDISILHAKKLEMIERSGVLEYKETCAQLDEIGGNKAFKDWVESLKFSFSDEAKEFGLERPKGYLALGIPGTSKTYAAEAIAGEMKLPMISFSLSKIMDKRVGESEQKAQNAFRIIKANAPCLLLIDEIEKEIGGVASSNATDGGTVSRIFSQLLKFLNDNEDVFVVMTSNDVSKLPSELTRSGRLDTKWYFGLPTHEERIQIAKIHLDKYNKSYDESLLELFAKETRDFTGAEIKEVAKGMMNYLFTDYAQNGRNEFSSNDLMNAVKHVVPLFKSNRESIRALDEWAKDRALNASGDIKEQEVFVDPEDIHIELV